MRLLLYPLVVFPIASNVFARDFLPPIQIVTLTAADASTQECYLFQTTAGVKYTVQYSNDLTTWTIGDEIYGLGFEYAVAMRQLAAAPPPESNEGSGTEPPLPPAAPSINVSLRLQPSSDVGGGTVVSWPSLDDGSPVIASTTVPLDSAWDEIPLYLQSFGNYHFFVSHPSLSVPPPAQNPVLGEKDSAMFAMLEASLPAMNLEVANSVVRTRNAPAPAPPNPDDRRFYRVFLDPTLDTDQDGSADWAEFEIAARVAAGNSSAGPLNSGVSGNPFNSDTNNDGIPDGNQLDADLDGTPDANDPDASDQTAFIPLGQVPRYAVFPITNAQPPQSAEFPLQINDKGRVLYENGTWAGGVWTPLNAPSNLLSYGQSQTAFAIAMNDHDVILGQGGVIVGNEAFAGFPGQFEEAGVRCFWSSPAAVPAFVISNSNIRDGYASRWDGDVAFHGTRFRSQLSNDNRFTADFSVFTPGNGSEMGTVTSQSAVWTLPASGSNLSTYRPIGPDILFHNEAGMSWGYNTLEDAPYREGILLGAPSSTQIPFVPGNVIAMESGTIAIPSSDSSVAPVALIKGKWEPAPLYRYATDMAKDGTAIGDSHGELIAPLNINGKWTSIEKAAPGITAGWKDSTVKLLDTTANGWILAGRENRVPQIESAVMLPIRIAESSADPDFAEATGVDDYSIKSEDPGVPVSNKIWIMAPSGTGATAVILKSPLNLSTPLEVAAANIKFSDSDKIIINNDYREFTVTANDPISSGEDIPLTFKMGTVQSMSSPVGVKVMKRRTIKVSVHPLGSIVQGNPSKRPNIVPTKELLENYLNKIYTPQINAVFDVKMIPERNFEWDRASPEDFQASDPNNHITTGNGWLDTNGGVNYREETHILNSLNDSDSSINIYILGGGRIRTVLPWDSIIRIRTSIVFGMTRVPENTVFIDGDIDWYHRVLNNDPLKEQLRTIAHEVGHCLVGAGHADTQDAVVKLKGFKPESLVQERLMITGSSTRKPIPGYRLVKGEWDEAEKWMQNEEANNRIRE